MGHTDKSQTDKDIERQRYSQRKIQTEQQNIPIYKETEELNKEANRPKHKNQIHFMQQPTINDITGPGK